MPTHSHISGTSRSCRNKDLETLPDERLDRAAVGIAFPVAPEPRQGHHQLRRF